MDTLSAVARGMASMGSPHRVFDWDKAARLLVEQKPTGEVVAGLSSDLEYTGGVIWVNGDIVLDQYTYLSSNWATPVLVIDGDEIACWRFASDAPGWDESTKWPDSAVAIVRGEVKP